MKTSKNLIQEAHKIKGNFTGKVLGMQKLFRENQAKIRSNDMLTAKGQFAQIDKLKRKHEVAMVCMIEEEKEAHDRLISEARMLAERDLYKEPSKVEKNKETIFNAKMKELKGRVLFASNPTRAAEFLAEMVEAADHPTLARSIQDEFFTLGQAVLQSAGGSVEASHKVRQALGNTHNKLVRATQVEGAGEAFEVLQRIEAIENAAFVDTAKYGAAFNEFSKYLNEYANDTEAYKNVHRDRILRVQMEHSDMTGALITK
ncbi:hypothetical protein [Bacillus sp. EE-W1]|uniref:hypothetical protein n=1 Tax=Bacillus sp. EE-W1 TaxID=2662453 RepID=UPI0012F8B015|nr:hypothetical protein [Bacillus sp. EE-W1]